MDVGNLISCSYAFSKSSLNIWKFSVHVLLKPSLENFQHYFASLWVKSLSRVQLFPTLWTVSMGFFRQEYWSGLPMWDEGNCVVVWAFSDIAFLWEWNENWPFPVLWPLLSFPNLLILSCEQILNSKIATHCWTTINRRMLDPTKKWYPQVPGQRRSPNKMVAGAKVRLESKPIPARTLCAPGPRDPTGGWARPAFECSSPTEAWVAVACLRDRGSVLLQQTWEAQPVA